MTEDGLCNVLCDGLLPPPFPSPPPPSLIPFHSSHPSLFPSSLSLPSLRRSPPLLSPLPLPISFSPPLPFLQFSLSSAAQHQPDTRVGALVVHHPGRVTTPVGLDRTTVHWGPYDGRPWVARTTQYAIAGDMFCFSFACDVFFLFFCRRFSFVRVFSSAGVFLSCGGVVFMCQGLLLTLPLCFSSLPVCVFFSHARECFFPWPVCVCFFFAGACMSVCVFLAFFLSMFFF